MPRSMFTATLAGCLRARQGYRSRRPGNNWWLRTTKAAGVTGVTVHSLRHHFASGLIADGCDVVTVQRALGHKSPSVTLNTYSHLWPTAEDRTRQAASGLAAEALAVAAADSLRTEEVK